MLNLGIGLLIPLVGSTLLGGEFKPINRAQ
jgi:hypothetical protein